MEVRPKGAKAPAGERPMFQGTASEVIDDIRAYQALGVTHFVFDAAHADLKSLLQNLERFAEDVRPVVARGARPARTTGGLARTRRGAARATSRPKKTRR